MAVSRFFLPTSVEEAVALLAEHGPDVLLMGGGTLVMAAVNDGTLRPRLALGLHRAALAGIEPANGHVAIGATTPVARLPGLVELPALAAAAAELGGPALRTLATVGGNLFAAPPYGDLAVALLALDAEVELAGPNGRRSLPLDAFYAGRASENGVGREVVTRLRVPRPTGVSSYHKLGRRRANTPSVVAVALRLGRDADGRCRDVRIALGAASPTPIRVRSAEEVLEGRPLDGDVIASAAEAAMQAADPPTDALASAAYRRRMVGVMVRRGLESAVPALEAPGSGHDKPLRG